MREFTWVIWDLLALAVLVITVRRCAAKGFLRTIAGLITSIAAAVGAGILSLPLAVFIYERLVRDIIRMNISGRISEQMEQGLVGAADWMSALPGWAARMIPPGMRADTLQITEGLTPAVEAFIDAALAQPVIMILRGLCFFLLFAVFLAVGRKVVWLLGGIGRLPLIGGVNAMLGGILGVGWALIILYLMASAAWIYIALTGGGGQFISLQTIGRGYLFSFFFRLAS